MGDFKRVVFPGQDMKLLRWTALPATFALLMLSSCSGETAKTAEPTPAPAPSISLAPHTVDISPHANGNQVQIVTKDPSLSHADCSALIDHYLSKAGQKGQVVVQKPGSKTFKGALLPYCVNNRDDKGTFFNDYFFK